MLAEKQTEISGTKQKPRNKFTVTWSSTKVSKTFRKKNDRFSMRGWENWISIYKK